MPVMVWWNESMFLAVHTIPLDQEYLLFPQKQCDRLSFELEKSLSHDEYYKSLFVRNRLLVDYLSFKTGEKSITPDVFFDIFDTLYIENLKKTEWVEKIVIHQFHSSVQTYLTFGNVLIDRLNLTFDAWADHLFKEPSQLQNISIFLTQSFTNSSELQKLTSGFLLKEILDRFINKTTQPLFDPDRVLWMYITNDAAIVNVLNTLGLFTVNFQWNASIELFFSEWNLFCLCCSHIYHHMHHAFSLTCTTMELKIMSKFLIKKAVKMRELCWVFPNVATNVRWRKCINYLRKFYPNIAMKMNVYLIWKQFYPTIHSILELSNCNCWIVHTHFWIKFCILNYTPKCMLFKLMINRSLRFVDESICTPYRFPVAVVSFSLLNAEFITTRTL